MLLNFGWNEEGRFVLLVTQNGQILHRVSMTEEQVNEVRREMDLGPSTPPRRPILMDHLQIG